MLLLDCGATTNFISQKFVTQHEIPTTTTSTSITYGDGRTSLSSSITSNLSVQIAKSLSYNTKFIVASKLPDCHIILGMPFLDQFNPIINWKKGYATINNQAVGKNLNENEVHSLLNPISSNPNSASSSSKSSKSSTSNPTTHQFSYLMSEAKVKMALRKRDADVLLVLVNCIRTSDIQTQKVNSLTSVTANRIN